ncbi:MAG: hypothetical protein HYS38_06915 [Acidobacteria bacterium]|nr:hypothetical protein [Acidobacteriota bacterium]
MTRQKIVVGLLVCLLLSSVYTHSTWAQTSDAVAQEASGLRLVQFSGVLKDHLGQPLSGVQGVTFALYKEQSGGAALWIETQNVTADAEGRFGILLGATTSDGLPLELFTSNEARWLGVQLNLPGEPEQPRVLLVSVPYALKAADAETLGGQPLSAFVLTDSNPSRDRKGAVSSSSGGSDKAGLPVAAFSDAITTAAVDGSGTTNNLAKFTSASAVGDAVGLVELNGNLGLGTTVPVSRMHLKDTVTRMLFEQTGPPARTWVMGTDNSPDAFFISDLTAGANRFLLDSTGKVGFGTGTPGADLELYRATNAELRVSAVDEVNDRSAILSLRGSGNGGALGAGAILDFTDSDPSPSSPGALQFTKGGATYLTLLNGGNLGIGTTSPTERLEVAGNLKVSGNYIGSISSTGTLALPNTTNASTGVLTLGGNPFLHNYGPADAFNTFVGQNAGNFTMGGLEPLEPQGTYNTASGSYALKSNTTGHQNTASGASALYKNTTGHSNTASGQGALYENTSGVFNTASGKAALYNNTTGSFNTASGGDALNLNTTGSFNTASGNSALQNNTTASYNTASGESALYYNTGGNNTALGYQAGVTATFANRNLTGSNNTFIGFKSGPGVDGTTTPLTNATAIGANAVVSASNALVLGSINGVNGATSSVNVGIGTASPTEALDVAGNVKVSGGLAVGGGASITNSNNIIQSGASAVTVTVLSGTAITASNCITQLVSVPGATTSMAVVISPAGDPNTNGLGKVIWQAYVNANDQVTAEFCKFGMGTATASTNQTFNIRVLK